VYCLRGVGFITPKEPPYSQFFCGGRPEGKRSIGRPRLRWLDDDVNYLRNMGVKHWRKKAEDKRKCPGIVREAKVKLRMTI
jgi:hypothetical protein